MQLAQSGAVPTVKKVSRRPPVSASPDVHVVALNVAALGVADELLRLPSSPVARSAVELLWGRDAALPDEFLAHVGTAVQIPYTSLLASSGLLAAILPSRLGPAGVWREGPNGVKSARALARARYRDLQAAFVSGAPRAVPEAAEALVRYTYGTRGRPWTWDDSARRLLERVVSLNRAALALLAAVGRGEGAADLDLAPLQAGGRSFDVPEAVVDLLAVALPPVVAPDWGRLAARMVPFPAPLGDEESIDRFRSLFAEMLGLSSQPEVSA
jgi:hypothetical protein